MVVRTACAPGAGGLCPVPLISGNVDVMALSGYLSRAERALLRWQDESKPRRCTEEKRQAVVPPLWVAVLSDQQRFKESRETYGANAPTLVRAVLGTRPLVCLCLVFSRGQALHR